VNQHRLAKLLAEAERSLTPEQRNCVLVKLVDLGIADNRLSKDEIGVITDWRQIAPLADHEYQRCYDTLLASASIGVLINESPSGPDWIPINLLCAAMIGVIRHQPASAQRRLKALERRVQSTDAMNSGQTYLEQLGEDGLATVVGGMLQPAQRNCVLANVLREAYLAGEPSPEIQAYLQLLRVGMEFTPGEFEACAKVFRQLGNPTLLRESPGQK